MAEQLVTLIKEKDTNDLFPVFLKLEQLRTFIIGGGVIGLEKLNAVVQNSPAASVKLVAITIKPEIKELADQYEEVQLYERAYEAEDFDDVDIVIVAVNDKNLSREIYQTAKSKGRLVNVADTPETV